MSNTFRNIVFVLVAGGCLLVTGLNHYTTVGNSEVVNETLHSFIAQQAEANQIKVAQTYGTKMGQIAFYETFRAASLEVQKDEANELIADLGHQLESMGFQAQIYDMALEAQGSYIQQLSAFIESKGLEVPVPLPAPDPIDPRHIHPTDPYPSTYHESLLDENGHPSTIVSVVIDEKRPAKDSIGVTVIGTLRTGILATGSETTVTTITAKGITWELEFGARDTLRQLSERIGGEKVMVQGSLERRGGVAIKERWIVTVTHLRAVYIK